MSLYNMLFGESPLSDILLKMLGLTRADTGRFRDCYITKWGGPSEGDKTPRIAIYTRNGGGNREDYQHVTDALQAHPNYLDDFDDDFDCTYATYIFSVPEKYKELVDAFEVEYTTPQEKFLKLIEELNKGTA